jgi:hypothetical protein
MHNTNRYRLDGHPENVRPLAATESPTPMFGLIGSGRRCQVEVRKALW